LNLKNPVLLPIALALTVYFFSVFVMVEADPGIPFIPSSFMTHCTMALLSIILIAFYSRHVKGFFFLGFLRLKDILKPLAVIIIILIITQALTAGAFMLLLAPEDVKRPSDNPEQDSLFPPQSPIQVLLFVFLLASIGEELLWRGFFQNALYPLKEKGFTLFKVRFSLPVILGGIFFGLGHLILLSRGLRLPFVIITGMVVFSSTLIGITAGYFQEKHDNFAFAVIVHSAANIPAVLFALQA